MFSAKAELPQKSTLQIKQDDKFFCRLLSKESSISNPSFRVLTAAVPFVWESQPGTPKYNTFSEETLPTLTPPPSYYFRTINTSKIPVKKSSRFSLFQVLFPKLNIKRTEILSSNFSSSSSVWSSPVSSRRRFLSHGSSFYLRADGEEKEDEAGNSPTSTILCFGILRTTSSKRRA